MAAGEFRERSLLPAQRLHHQAAAAARRGEDLPLLVDSLPPAVQPRAGEGRVRRRPGGAGGAAGHPWPGNVRELQSVLKQALLQATGPVLVPDFLPPTPFAAKANETTTPTPTSSLDLPDLEQFVNDRLMAGSPSSTPNGEAVTEKFLLTHGLRHTGGNLSRTAQILGIHRSTLRAKIAASSASRLIGSHPR